MKAILFVFFGTIMMIVMRSYGDSLAALVDETTKNIQAYVNNEAANIATIAQRVNISLKVALTIV